MSLYTDAVAKGLTLDSHESDLYVLATPEAVSLVKRHKWAHSAFVGNDGKVWLDVPFAFDPWWEARQSSR